MNRIPSQFIIFLLGIVLVFSLSTCSKDSTEPPMQNPNREVWTGADLTFVKADSVDVTLEENQDRLTDKVWITRDDGGGQIYNIRVEDEADKTTSPAGTKWAEGAISEIDNLVFRDFRATVEPQQVVGKNLVMHLVEDNIYLSVRFTSWSMQKKGGFSYVRSTP